MIMSIANLPPNTTEQDLRALFDGTQSIEKITLIDEGNRDKLMALLEMDIEMETAEAMRHRYHRRWWHGRVLNVNVMLH